MGREMVMTGIGEEYSPEKYTYNPEEFGRDTYIERHTKKTNDPLLSGDGQRVESSLLKVPVYVFGTTEGLISTLYYGRGKMTVDQYVVFSAPPWRDRFSIKDCYYNEVLGRHLVLDAESKTEVEFGTYLKYQAIAYYLHCIGVRVRAVHVWTEADYKMIMQKHRALMTTEETEHD